MKKGLWRARQGRNVPTITDLWFGYRSRFGTESASVSRQGLANQNGPAETAISNRAYTGEGTAHA